VYNSDEEHNEEKIRQKNDGQKNVDALSEGSTKHPPRQIYFSVQKQLEKNTTSFYKAKA